ncbi:MAG TPA: ATP-binding cassette domain-containing protein [Candidatus Omnitrophota bacterium]|nr:ATP-binding cassette domain-containing protein [Candidatus Omnitrophota bacterium]HQJ15109.1 ATP-binding cassette domain-containing protein [Candidatus Omnitrophota bacterium]
MRVIDSVHTLSVMPFRALLKRFGKQIFALVFIELLSGTFFLAAPFFSGFLIDEAFLNRDWQAFTRLSIAGGAVFIFSAAVGFFGEFLKNRIAVQVRLKLTGGFLRKLYGLDLPFFQSVPSGETMYRFFDIETTASFLTGHIPDMIKDIVQSAIILAVAMAVNPRLTIFMLILSPLLLLRSIYVQKRLLPVFSRVWESSSALSRRIFESLSRMYIIKAMGLEHVQRRMFMRELVSNLRWKSKNFRLLQADSLLSSFLSKFIYGLVTLYGGWLIIRGEVTLGSYTAVMIYLTQLGALFHSAGTAWQYCLEERVSLAKLSDIMEADASVADTVSAQPVSRLDGEIEFKNVSFGYLEGSPVLRDLSFIIPAHSMTVITGPSGCGKSTILNLLLRLYEPWNGIILYDRTDFKVISIASLRSRIGIASQQPFLFDDTIRANIAYGLEDIRQSDIEAAARIACIHDEIRALPQGYDTVIGEDACRLSHGQKQRLAIARALARQPDLLIMDEATAAVDPLAEEDIFRQLSSWRKGRSIIVVSHRQSVQKLADTVMVLGKDGIKIL